MNCCGARLAGSQVSRYLVGSLPRDRAEEDKQQSGHRHTEWYGQNPRPNDLFDGAALQILFASAGEHGSRDTRRKDVSRTDRQVQEG